jgi:hypothetical protein
MRKLIFSTILCLVECAAFSASAASPHASHLSSDVGGVPIGIEIEQIDTNLEDDSLILAGASSMAGAAGGQAGKGILEASQFGGSDCGAKVNAADAALGKARGEINVDSSCGTNWTTPVVLGAHHNLKITQTESYVIQGISFSGNNILDLGGSTIQIAPYSPAKAPTGLFTTYVDNSPASDVTIQNGVLDGNSANTPSATYCITHIQTCHPAIEINSKNNGVNAAHGITIRNIKFQNWNYYPIAIQGFNSYPLPYDIYILNNEFLNSGGNVIGSSGWDHNFVIRGNVFNNWGAGAVGAPDKHADAIYTIDYTGYNGTSGFDMDISDNIFITTNVSGSGFGYVAEIGAAGLGWTRNFTFSNNHMNDNGTNYGLTLSGDFFNATISNNVWTSQCAGELMGSNITMTGNNCINGSVTIGPPNYFSSVNNVIATNQITIPGTIGAPLTQVNQKAIMAAGYPPLSSPITRVIKQSAQTFSAAGGSLTTVTFHPRVSATPPLMVVAGMTGLTTNQYQNWAFTLACAAYGGNNGTFIVYSNTATSMSFVNPFAVSETLQSKGDHPAMYGSYCSSGATLTSSSTTAVYLGDFKGGRSLIAGSFNGLVGVPNVSTTDFANTGNNVTNATVLANSMTAIAINNPSAVSATAASGAAWTMTLWPLLQNTLIANNAIDMQNSTGDSTAIKIGRGDGGRPGQMIGTTIIGNTITSSTRTSGAGSTVRGIGLVSQPGITASLDTNILDNDISNVGIGIFQEDHFMSFNDVTIVGNKLVNIGGGGAITLRTPPTVLREWNNITSATQTTENLNGGVTIDSSGNAIFPGKAVFKAYGPSVVYSTAGTRLPSCTSEIKGQQAVVGDATNPTYMGAYKSGGSITAVVVCSFNGSSYTWLTH